MSKRPVSNVLGELFAGVIIISILVMGVAFSSAISYKLILWAFGDFWTGG